MADPVNLHTYISVAVELNLQDEIWSTSILQVLIRPIYIFQINYYLYMSATLTSYVDY